MSLVRESDAYKPYYDLCYYTEKTLFRKIKSKKKNSKPVNHNRTVESIQNEINEMRAHA